MGNPQNRELLSKIFGALHDTPSQDKKQGMNTTSVAGYPVFICWGRWGGSEVNQSGNNKGFIFLPYLQTGQMPLSRYSNPNWFVNTHLIKYKKHNKQRIANINTQVPERKKQELELDDFIQSTSDEERN